MAISEIDRQQKSVALRIANEILRERNSHSALSQHFSSVPDHLIKPMILKHSEYFQSKPPSSRFSGRNVPLENGGHPITAKSNNHQQEAGTVKLIPLNDFAFNHEGQVRRSALNSV